MNHKGLWLLDSIFSVLTLPQIGYLLIVWFLISNTTSFWNLFRDKTKHPCRGPSILSRTLHLQIEKQCFLPSSTPPSPWIHIKGLRGHDWSRLLPLGKSTYGRPTACTSLGRGTQWCDRTSASNTVCGAQVDKFHGTHNLWSNVLRSFWWERRVVEMTAKTRCLQFCVWFIRRWWGELHQSHS